MMKQIKNICFFFVIGLLVQWFSVLIDSDYLIKFMDNSLITILLALLAINTTTMSVIMTKLKEISEKRHSDFSATIAALKFSINEQVALIITALVIQIAKNSSKIHIYLPCSNFLFPSLLFGIFCCAIYILYDTANGIFVILRFEEDDRKND